MLLRDLSNLEVQNGVGGEGSVSVSGPKYDPSILALSGARDNGVAGSVPKAYDTFVVNVHARSLADA